jgi:rRNA maturation endonuclease Nob1
MLLAAIGAIAAIAVIAFLGLRYVRRRPAKPRKRRRAVKKGVCPNCDKPVSEEFKLCPYCGYQLKK